MSAIAISQLEGALPQAQFRNFLKHVALQRQFSNHYFFSRPQLEGEFFNNMIVCNIC
jgi:hypothetical protein